MPQPREPDESVAHAAPPVAEGVRRRGWVFVGVGLMGGSLLLWVSLLGVPFLPLSVATRGTVATVVIVVAEVAFWGGAALAGPEAVRRMRSRWRRPRPERS